MLDQSLPISPIPPTPSPPALVTIILHSFSTSSSFLDSTYKWYYNSTSRYTSKENENKISKRYLYSNDYCGIIYNSQDIEMTLGSVKWWMDKEDVRYIYTYVCVYVCVIEYTQAWERRKCVIKLAIAKRITRQRCQTPCSVLCQAWVSNASLEASSSVPLNTILNHIDNTVFWLFSMLKISPCPVDSDLWSIHTFGPKF